MALKLGWFAVRDLAPADIARVLDEARGRVKPEADSTAFRAVSGGDRFTSVMLVDNYACVHEWAEAVSAVAQTITLSFFVFEGTWSYVVSERGARVLHMDTWEKKAPTLDGDVRRAADLFNVGTEVFARYFDVFRKSRRWWSLGVADQRAFTDDKHSATDEWTHVDFARRLGDIVYPEQGAPGAIELDHRLPRRPPISRPLVNDDVETVFAILAERTPPTDGPFAVRFPRWMNIAKNGSAADLADVVRDHSRRPYDVLSFGEKRMIEALRDRLATEIAEALGCSPAEARATIDRAVG